MSSSFLIFFQTLCNLIYLRQELSLCLYVLFLGQVLSSVTAHLGKTKVDLKEASKFVTG